MNSCICGVSQVEPKPTVVVDLEPARGLVLVGAQLRLGRVDLGGHVARGAIEQLALLGQDQAARMAVEQRDAQLLLERADLAADRRLAEIQRLARMGEAARLGDRVENPQLVPVHRPSPSLAPPSVYSAALRDAALQGGEEILGLERGHAAHAGGRHGLAENLVLDVARGKDAGDVGRSGIGPRQHIALAVDARACP